MKREVVALKATIVSIERAHAEVVQAAIKVSAYAFSLTEQKGKNTKEN